MTRVQITRGGAFPKWLHTASVLDLSQTSPPKRSEIPKKTTLIGGVLLASGLVISWLLLLWARVPPTKLVLAYNLRGCVDDQHWDGGADEMGEEITGVGFELC
jgi:hypothetical protein